MVAHGFCHLIDLLQKERSVQDNDVEKFVTCLEASLQMEISEWFKDQPTITFCFWIYESKLPQAQISDS